MIRDLRTILDGWEYEPGKISVRKIIGRDGREKIQMRIDLGVLQLETRGRPDNQRPHNCESLLEYHEKRLFRHIQTYGSDEEFVISPEDCRELRHEAYLYYQRYLAQFVLEEFDAVERDTARNLRVIEFCERYAAAETDRRALLDQRDYVQMMHTRGKAYRALKAEQHETALAIVAAGIEKLVDHEDPLESYEERDATEIRVLRELHEEIIEAMPDDAKPKLEHRLALALEEEDYEEAARLRDLLGLPQRRMATS